MANEFKVKNGIIISGSADIEQNLTVRGTLTADQYNVSIVSTSILYESGSTKFGDSLDDSHEFTGSVAITGSITLNGQAIGTGKLDETTFNSYTSSISSSIGGLSSSIATTDLNQDNRISSLETASGSIRTDFNSFTSSYTTVSSSLDSRLDVLETYSGSQLVPSSSMSFRTLQTDVYCKNTTGVQINKGTVVRIAGSVGDNPLISIADPNTEHSSANTLGITTQDIPNDDFGLVITEGVLVGVNTDGMTAGDLVYLGTNGTFTTTTPIAPAHGVRLGEVLRVQQNNGSIYVRIDNGMELNEAHDVIYSGITTGDLLIRSGSVWKNSKNLNGDYTVTGSLTITQNLNVLGSSSITYVTASQLIVSSSTISVNVFEPAERFGGLKVYDSGSSTATASLLWDSLHNHWVYQNASGSLYSGGMLLSGPRNTGSLGDEPNLISGRIVKSVGGDHIDVSIISETGTTINVAGDLVANSITGAFDFFGLVNRPTLVSGSSQIEITGTTGYSEVSTSIDLFNSFTSSYSTGSFTGSFIGDGTGLQLNKIITGSASASIDDTGLYVNRDLYVDGIITAKEFHTDYITSSVLFQSGSTKFGDTFTDTHQFTGSIYVSGHINANSLTGSINFNNLTDVPTLVSGSSQILNGTNIVSGSDQLTGSYDTRYVLSGSITQTTWDNIANKPSGIVSGSQQIVNLGFLETSSFNTMSSSINTRVETLELSDYNQDAKISSLTNKTGSYATTGSNAFVGNENINGNLSVTGSVVISGSIDITNANVGNSRFLFTQVSGSTTWNIVHNLGYSYPNVTVYDGSNNKVMIPADVISVDPNTIQVTFATPEYGYALVSMGGLSTTTSDAIIYSLQTSTSSLNTFTSSAITRLNSIEGVSGSYATTGSNLFKGAQTISGSIIPAVTNTYDLGSETNQFRHLYLSSASLYIDGTKVLGSTTQELQITTDTGQAFKILEDGSDNITLQSADGNIELKSSGGGDVILDPTTGVIALKGTTTLYAGNKILSSDGNAIQIGNSTTITGSLIVTDFIETQELRTTYISSSILYRSGSTKFGDELSDTHTFTGSLLISGSVTAVGSNLFSGSAQLPSGILSGSGTENQIPIWGTGGTVLSNSRITQPDSNNIRINHGDTYTLGAKFTYNSTYVSTLTLGRTNTGADSNVSMIYDIANTEVFEIRRNYSAASFKISLGETAHLTIANTGAATFNSTITTGGDITANGGSSTAVSVYNTSSIRAKLSMTGNEGDLSLYGSSANKTVYLSAYYDSYFNSGKVGIGLTTPQAILDVSHTAGTTNIIRVSNGSGNYRWRVDQNFAMIMTNASGTDTFSVSTSGSISTPAQFTSFATAPLSFQSNGNTGTYTQTTIYANQNNTSGDIANGIFIERGYTDTSNTELRQFVIGARGGSYQWKLSGPGGTFQRDACEVKPAGDGDLFVGRYSGGAAKVFRVYQASADGYLELQTGAGDIVTKLSGYGGTPNFTMTNFGFGKSSGISYRIDASSGGGQVARFATNQSGAGIGQCAEFINSSASGYGSWIYIGSAPGTDWKIGKNISNSANTTYHFEIVDSSNNLRMQINNSTGNVTFSGTVTQNSDIRLKKNIRDIDGALNKVLQIRGVLYDKMDETETNQFGFIAQELESVLPELVLTSDLDVKSVKYQNIGPLLAEAIKELKLENDNLKLRIEQLENN